MSELFGKQAATLDELKTFYDKEYASGMIKDEDHAYAWMAKTLFCPYITNKSVLDVGCGGGFFMRELNGIACSVTGIDISTTALQHARNLTEHPLILASAEELPFKNNSFDTVICLGSLEHFLDLSKALGQFSRVLSPEGWIFVMVPNLFWYKDIWSVLKTGDIKSRNQQYELFASPGRWQALFRQNHLQTSRIWKYNGISKNSFKQKLKDLLIPLNLSYHLIFGLQKS